MAFRRLAGVTQVVSPGEGEIFHNRLTHSIKVAQIARRFAENLAEKNADIVAAWGGLDPEVTEAAALAHDLGHPPFGHIAEEELDHLIKSELDAGTPGGPFCGLAEGYRRHSRAASDHPSRLIEGYEGNAQSFRIVTRLAIRRESSCYGLDLTRATLNAILKYPWKSGGNSKKPTKYGAYECDADAFEFARDGSRSFGRSPNLVRSLEAQIMDWSDDIAYSVHDTEDFYRAGLIPLERLTGGPESDRFLEYAADQAERAGIPAGTASEFVKVFNRLFKSRIRVREPFNGTQEQQQLLYEFVSDSINQFVTGTSLREPPGDDGEAVVYSPDVRLEVFLLKQLTWRYVIDNPSLAGHQLGQRLAIRVLFREFNAAIKEQRWALFPPFFRDRARTLHEENAESGEMPAKERVRLVSDTISSMTDKQAFLVYHQFTGSGLGSMLDPVIR